MAVRHPEARIADVEEDVHRLPFPHQDRVLPDQVRFGDPVPGEDQEAACAMDVEGVVHGMVGVHLVDQADLHLVSHREPPCDGAILCAGVTVHELPAHVGRGRHPVDLDHVVFPLDAIVRWLTGAFRLVVLVDVVLVRFGSGVR